MTSGVELPPRVPRPALSASLAAITDRDERWWSMATWVDVGYWLRPSCLGAAVARVRFGDEAEALELAVDAGLLPSAWLDPGHAEFVWWWCESCAGVGLELDGGSGRATACGSCRGRGFRSLPPPPAVGPGAATAVVSVASLGGGEVSALFSALRECLRRAAVGPFVVRAAEAEELASHHASECSSPGPPACVFSAAEVEGSWPHPPSSFDGDEEVWRAAKAAKGAGVHLLSVGASSVVVGFELPRRGG